MEIKECRVLIDWLTFSVKGRDDPRDVVEYFLGMDSDLFKQAPCSPLPGYQQALEFKHIYICYDGREDEYFKDLGICVSMSGDGCRTFEEYSTLKAVDESTGEVIQQGVNSAFPPLLWLISQYECTVSRLDLAIDEFNGLLNVPAIMECAKSGEVNSRMKKVKGIFDLNGQDDEGSTVYFGAESSDFRIRIYDKGKQLRQSDPWVRVEMVLKRDNSTAFVNKFIEGWELGQNEDQEVGSMARSILMDKLRFINRDDSNISRCSLKDWWAEFLGSVEALRVFSRVVAEHGVDHLAQWLIDQVAPALALTFEAYHGTWFRTNIIEAGKKRWSKRYQALYDDFQRDRGLNAAGG